MRIVYNQNYHNLGDNKLLLGCRSGLRSLHGTLTALLEATNVRSVNNDNGLLNGLVFIDHNNKAFDTIDHEIIDTIDHEIILRKILRCTQVAEPRDVISVANY